jgi:hypothetical protein
LIGRVEGERRARIKNINRPSKRKEKGIWKSNRKWKQKRTRTYK